MVPPVGQAQDPVPAQALPVAELVQPFVLVPPAARFRIGAHAAVHVLAVGGKIVRAQSFVVAGIVRALGHPVGDDEALLDARVGQVEGQPAPEREVIAQVGVEEAEVVAAVHEIAAAARQPAGQGVLEGAGLVGVMDVDAEAVEARSRDLDLGARRAGRQRAGDQIEDPAQGVAEPRVADALDDLDAVDVGQRDHREVDEIAARGPRRVEQAAVPEDLDAPAAETPDLDGIVVHGRAHFLDPLDVHSGLAFEGGVDGRADAHRKELGFDHGHVGGLDVAGLLDDIDGHRVELEVLGLFLRRGFGLGLGLVRLLGLLLLVLLFS
ncbi:MAG: hypothetical protein MZV63_13450 [Marinilabiliales bacterium]|nr:hypothetical protein [Marinilabiliales bacterium]